MATLPKYTPHVKSDVASATKALMASDHTLWSVPVQANEQSRALKVLQFAWSQLGPIVPPVFPKSPDKPEIIAAALQTQATVLMVLRVLKASSVH